jgi:beta-lactamase class A
MQYPCQLSQDHGTEQNEFLKIIGCEKKLNKTLKQIGLTLAQTENKYQKSKQHLGFNTIL